MYLEQTMCKTLVSVLCVTVTPLKSLRGILQNRLAPGNATGIWTVGRAAVLFLWNIIVSGVRSRQCKYVSAVVNQTKQVFYKHV